MCIYPPVINIIFTAVVLIVRGGAFSECRFERAAKCKPSSLVKLCSMANLNITVISLSSRRYGMIKSEVFGCGCLVSEVVLLVFCVQEKLLRDE